MKNPGKLIGRICLGALAASLLPYRIQIDTETGEFKVCAVLWSVKKTPGTEQDRYEFELLPLFGGKKAPDETPDE